MGKQIGAYFVVTYILVGAYIFESMTYIITIIIVIIMINNNSNNNDKK